MFRPDDPLSILIDGQPRLREQCPGLDWLTSLVDKNPAITIAEGVQAAQAQAKAGHLRSTWCADLLAQQWDRLYPELRLAMIELLDRKLAAWIALNRTGFTDAEKAVFRRKVEGKLRAAVNQKLA